MPTFEHVGRNGRVYRRSFDYAEAALLREQGLTFAEIGARFGVSGNTIERAVKPHRQARQLENSKRWRTGICEGCGGPAMRLVAGKREHNPDGRVLCIRCRGHERRERLLFDDHGVLIAVRCDTLNCANGERWQPPEHFPRGSKARDVREGGIHGQCRACLTRARQDYRERHKVPCERCGKLCLPPNEKGGNGRRSDRSMCLACYRETELPPHHDAAVRASAVARKARARSNASVKRRLG